MLDSVRSVLVGLGIFMNDARCWFMGGTGKQVPDGGQTGYGYGGVKKIPDGDGGGYEGGGQFMGQVREWHTRPIPAPLPSLAEGIVRCRRPSYRSLHFPKLWKSCDARSSSSTSFCRCSTIYDGLHCLSVSLRGDITAPSLMEGAKVLELYELTYSDLILLSSPSNGDESTNNESIEEFERLETIRRRLMETLGPKGPGLLSITAVPKASLLRRKLLPLARKLALLDPEQRKQLLKEHKLGSDVPLKNPDRNVSSFAMQLKYDEALDSCIGTDRPAMNSNLASIDVYNIEKFQDNVFGNLSETFTELGFCMMDMGLRVAQVCDKAIGGNVLEQSLLESGTAKGRLIHYHSALDSFVIRENGRGKGKNKYKEQSIRSDLSNVERSDLVSNEIRLCANRADLWQQWHYDYGIFTILTAPMFLASCDLSNDIRKVQGSLLCDQECCYPNGCSYLQIFDPNKNSVFMVKTSPESFIIQVGESADILSRGKLRSKLHCVCRPRKLENLSRETFVMFLQPAWTKTFSISDHAVEQCIFGDSLSHIENDHLDQGLNEFTREILKLVPPLSSRLKDGMTFAEFSRETTKQYFGGNGLQSNK